MQKNLDSIRARIAAACQRSMRSTDAVHLVAVTKSVGVDLIRGLYELGVRDFGESRPQSIWERAPQLPADARWHLIGPLQTNKVRRTLPLVSLVHSLDRWSLAEAISAEATKTGRSIAATVEVNLTGEESKGGFSEAAIRTDFPRLRAMPGVGVCGLMTMARLEAEPEACRPTFDGLRQLRDELQAATPNCPGLEILSMGMSNDFEIAIEAGATHVRIGTALFEGLQ